MGVFYHPFGENGNIAKVYLLNDTDDTILLEGEEGCNIFPMLDGAIKQITSNSITIETETSGYSKQTNEKVTITYGHFQVNEEALKGENAILKTISIGKLSKMGDEPSPYLTISMKSNDKSISVDELYKKDPNLVPKYDELRKKGLVSYSTNTVYAADSNYAKLIFVQEPNLSTTYDSNEVNLDGIIGVAVGELCDMIANPYPYTGYSKDGLGGVEPNKYQDFTGMGLNGHWCAAFVSYCAFRAGYVESGLYPGPKYTSCGALISTFESNGNPPKSSMQYTPVPGDLIFFNWSDSKYDGVDHIGIVYQVTQDSVYTIEGNSTRKPENFVGDVASLHSISSPDPIVSAVETACEGTFDKDGVDNIKQAYRQYVEDNYDDVDAPFTSEFNGVTLRRYDLSDSDIEEYIHME